MNRPEFRAGILFDATTDETVDIGAKLSSLTTKSPDEESDDRDARLAVIDRIDIAPGEIRISISAEGLAEMLGVHGRVSRTTS